MKKYDAIFIGAGLGSLSAAAKLVHSGKKVLIIDQHYVIGGCASTFRRKKFIFDAAVHLMGGCEEGGLIEKFLSNLGLNQKINFIEINPMYVASIGEDRYNIPSNLYELEEKMCEWFPDDKEGIKQVISKIIKIGGLLLQVSSTETQDGADRKEIIKELSGIRNVSFKEFLERYLNNPKAISVLSTLFLYAGESPNELSAQYIISVLMSYHNGAFYPKGSTQAFANLLGDYIKANGSDIVLRRKVEKIRMSNGQVTGVIDHKGNEYYSDVIVSNADMKSTYLDLLGEEHLSSLYKKKFEKLTPSCSAIVLYAGIKDDDNWSKNIPHELFVFPQHVHHNPQYLYHPQEKSITPMSICCPSNVDPSLAPPEHSIVTVTALCNYDEIESIRLKQGKEFLVDDFLNRIEMQLPGFRERIVLHELATPSTILRYTRNQNGAIYGWSKVKEQPWLAKMGPKSPVKGLYFTGHWTNNIHGVYGVIKSGLMTSQQIMNDVG